LYIDEGIVRVYRNYSTYLGTELVSSFRALTDLLPSTRGSGLIFDWQSSSGLLATSGDVRTIKFWDLEREHCSQEIPTRSESCLTSLIGQENSLLVAGCGDGKLRLYDRRIGGSDRYSQNFFLLFSFFLVRNN